MEDEPRVTPRPARTPRLSAHYGRQRPLVDFGNYILPVHRGSDFSSPGGAQLEAGSEGVQPPEGEDPGGVSVFDTTRPGQDSGGKPRSSNWTGSDFVSAAAAGF